MRYKVSPGQLRIFIRVGIDDFPFLAFRMIVCLEITPVQLTALERQLFDKSRNLIITWVKLHTFVLEIIDCKGFAVIPGPFL